MPLTKGPIITISQEELAILNKTQAAVCKIAMSTFAERLKEGDNFMVELCSVSYYGGKVSLDFLQAFYKFCKNITLELFMGMEEFKSLPINDRKQLMEVNGNLIHHYKAAISIDDDACMVQTIDAAAKSGKYPALTSACESAAKMGVQKRDKPRLEYSQFYQSPWAATLEDEEKHYWLVQQLRVSSKHLPTFSNKKTLIIIVQLAELAP